MHDADDMCPDHYAWSLIGTKAPSRPELATAVLQKLICAPVCPGWIRCLTVGLRICSNACFTSTSA